MTFIRLYAAKTAEGWERIVQGVVITSHKTTVVLCTALGPEVTYNPVQITMEQMSLCVTEK